jgi:very-short-patch-repair endonuclease
MTPAERSVWGVLRNRQRMGTLWRRQFVIDRYVADFACPALRLILEVDGSSHVGDEQRDAERTAFLGNSGWRVLRVWNSDVWRSRDGLVAWLESEMMQRAGHPPPPSWGRSTARLAEPSGGGGAKQAPDVAHTAESFTEPAPTSATCSGDTHAEPAQSSTDPDAQSQHATISANLSGDTPSAAPRRLQTSEAALSSAEVSDASDRRQTSLACVTAPPPDASASLRVDLPHKGGGESHPFHSETQVLSTEVDP